MLNSIEVIKNTFLEFKGAGTYLNIYILSLIYLFIKEDKKEMRMFFIYFQAILLIVIFNPIFNKLVELIFTESVYWRMYWTIPLGITIAYTAVKIISTESDRFKNVFLTISFILVIIVSGKSMYTQGNYAQVGNLYKLPDEEVWVTQLIGADDLKYKKALVPVSLTPYVRQIDSSIFLAYKRNPVGYDNNEFVEALNSGNTEKITELAKKNGCDYIVVKKDVPLTLDFYYFNYEYFNQTPNYCIYKRVRK